MAGGGDNLINLYRLAPDRVLGGQAALHEIRLQPRTLQQRLCTFSHCTYRQEMRRLSTLLEALLARLLTILGWANSGGAIEELSAILDMNKFASERWAEDDQFVGQETTPTLRKTIALYGRGAAHLGRKLHVHSGCGWKRSKAALVTNELDVCLCDCLPKSLSKRQGSMRDEVARLGLCLRLERVWFCIAMFDFKRPSREPACMVPRYDTSRIQSIGRGGAYTAAR